MNKIILVVSIVIIVIVVGVTTWFLTRDNSSKENNNYSKELNKLINNKVKTGTLKTIRYTRSGNFNGNIYVLEVDVENKTIRHEQKEYTSEPLVVKKYKIDDKDMDYILDNIKKYNYPGWKDLPMSDLVVFDAAIRDYTFIYDNSSVGGNSSESYVIDFSREIPEDGASILIDFSDYLETLLKEEYIINEYTK